MYLHGQFVIAEGGAAVIDGGKFEPLQCFGVTDYTEVVEMTVFVGNDIVQHNHPVEERHSVFNAERLAAIYKMPVHRGAVVLFLRFQDTPCGDQLGVFRDKILAHTVGSAFIPCDRIRHMRDAEAFHDFRGDHLVERLLPKRVAAAFDQAAFTVYDLPPLFQITVRGVVGGTEIQRVFLFIFPEQDIADIV